MLERGRGVSTEGGGRASEAGERETLSERGGRTPREKKGDAGSHTHTHTVFIIFLLYNVKALCSHHQRLEEIMKRTRRSDAPEKVKV